MQIYHIVLPEIWAAFNGELYSAASLETESFIHCSFNGQLEAVLGRYYSNVDSVVILEIDSEKLTSNLVNEPSTGGEIYPHIYGPINRDAIIATEERQI